VCRVIKLREDGVAHFTHCRFELTDAALFEGVLKTDESGSLKRLWDATAEWRAKAD
jgi:hypothetical protein